MHVLLECRQVLVKTPIAKNNEIPKAYNTKSEWFVAAKNEKHFACIFGHCPIKSFHQMASPTKYPYVAQMKLIPNRHSPSYTESKRSLTQFETSNRQQTE